jgi:hypothetical protein
LQKKNITTANESESHSPGSKTSRAVKAANRREKNTAAKNRNLVSAIQPCEKIISCLKYLTRRRSPKDRY